MPCPWRLFSKFAPKRWIKKRVLIVGDGPLAQALARVLVYDRSYRYDVKGFLSNNPATVGISLVNPKVLGTIDQLFALSEKHQIETVAVCVEDRRGTLPLDSLLDVKSMGLEVIDGHRLYETECGRLSIDELKPSFLIFSSGFRRKPIIMFLKRLGDIVGALLGLVVLGPLIVLIALLIKSDSHGPIFYRQTRVGQHIKFTL